MNLVMNIGFALLTAVLWTGYTLICIRLEERWRWFAEWGALSVPVAIVGLVLLNIWAGTNAVALFFTAFVILGFACAFDKMRLR